MSETRQFLRTRNTKAYVKYLSMSGTRTFLRGGGGAPFNVISHNIIMTICDQMWDMVT